tara:strand:- start:1090 stop:1254 length:165 start_codon:yes stop_codon:yes gene_type:complete
VSIKNNDKKALWLSPDMHKELKDFANKNYMKLEGAGEFLIKLGICQQKLDKKND